MENKSCVFLHCALLISNPLLREDFISLTCFRWKTNFWCTTAKTGMQSPEKKCCYFDIICFPLQLLFKGSAQVPGSLAAEEASDHRGASWDQLPCLLCNWMQASQAPELWPGSTDRSSNNGLVPIFLSFFFLKSNSGGNVDLRRYYDSHFYPLKKKN